MKILLTLAFVASFFTLKAQEWLEFYADDQVRIEYTKIDFEDPSHNLHHVRFVFRYTNLSDEDLELSFSRVLAYDNQELASSAEREFNIVIPALSTEGYDIERQRDKTFYVFVKDVNLSIKRQLTAFDLLNISTTTL